MNSRRVRQILILVLLLVAVALLAWYLGRPQPVPVTLATVEKGSVLATVANTRAGTVDACQRARLAPPVGGQIARLPFKEGDRVKAEEVLLELWNQDLRAQVLQAERDAVATRSRAREACVTAEVALKNAARVRQLRPQGLVSEGDLEKAVGEADARAAACDAARDQEKVSQARVDVARASLERTILRAPFAGVIAEINGEVGEFVTPSPVGIPTPPTVDLVDGSCLYISAPIDEVDAPAVRTGQRALITLDAFPQPALSRLCAARGALCAGSREAGTNRRRRSRDRRPGEIQSVARLQRRCRDHHREPGERAAYSDAGPA